MSERIRNAVSAVGAARAAAGSLATVDRELREKHAAAVRLVGALAGSPEPVDSVVANMRAAVDAIAARYDAEYGQQAVNAFSRRVEITEDLSVRATPGNPSWAPTLAPSWSNLYWLAPEAMKQALERSIRSCTYTAGLPIAEREAAIRKAQAEVRELEAEHEALVDEAAEHGIVLQHLPTVAARREREARAVELETHARANRQQLANRVSGTYPEAARIGRSKYLAGAR